VRSGNKEAKIWLQPQLDLAENRGFNSRELADIILLVARHKTACEAEWDEHFRD
jgi:hypothetical protein